MVPQRARSDTLQFAIECQRYVGADIAVAEEVKERLKALHSYVSSEFIVVATFDPGRTELKRELAGYMGVQRTLGIMTLAVEATIDIDRLGNDDAVGRNDVAPALPKVAHHAPGI